MKPANYVALVLFILFLMAALVSYRSGAYDDPPKIRASQS